MAASEVVFLCVGASSGADGAADMTAVAMAARSIGASLDRHQVLVTKSTVPIGSGRWLTSVIEDAGGGDPLGRGHHAQELSQHRAVLLQHLPGATEPAGREAGGPGCCTATTTLTSTKQLAQAADCPTVELDAYNPACVAGAGVDGRYRKGAGTVSVVVGTAGEPLSPLDDRDPEAGYMVATMGANREGRKGFLRLVATRDELTARFVGSTDDSGFGDRFLIGPG